MVASAQVTLLMLTARKSDCELGISIDAMHKQALTREQSELSKEYYSRLQAKKVCYYANGQYQKMNYNYLMGSPTLIFDTLGTQNIKPDNNMILADYKGQVVLNNDYAKVITSVLGSSAMDSDGRGVTFSQDKIPEMLNKMVGFADFTEDEIKNGIAEHSSYSATSTKTLSGESGAKVEHDNTATRNEALNKLLDFYLPIFKAAAANGWTTEYNKEMKLNDDYISDALVTGSFQLENVNDYGDYDEGTSLTYFITSGAVQERTDSSVRQEITAWYDAEKSRIAEKENQIDIHMSDLSTELEAIKTEMQSIQTFIDDGIESVFDWGSG